MTLKPWRDLIVPHDDVLKGTYQEAEFAADLSKVANGTAPPEYQDPVLFFERTYITEGMRLLLNSVLRRLSGQGGDPVIQLKTSFGGGKTHTMLAVYHVAGSGRPASDLAGVPPILDQVGINELPKANVAVIDGNNLSPSQARKRGSITVNTLWGELAYKLGKEAGYELLAQSDIGGTSPGKEILIELFTRFAPCVILLDELVAYVRQFEEGKSYAGGTFESNLSFLQALTEAASQVPSTMVLASLPESDLEAGGARGREALGKIEKVFGRVEAVWKPVATNEGFEIVRRRLFGQITDTNARDAVCRAFADMYVSQSGQFPSETIEANYFDRLKSAYPIHPEVFERLYTDWATLEKFQRTRGVLRLMAMVIHRLWTDNNHDLLIMPGSIPLYDSQISNELVRYLTQGWEPVIERDVDGQQAATTKMDSENPLFGPVQAARRVARTIFLGSAPAVSGQRIRGISDQSVRLGSTQPGQQIGRYDDALRRLLDQLHYLFTNNERNRFWYDTRPNLRREMEDRMTRFKRDEHLIPEIQKRLKLLLKSGPFSGVHVFNKHDDVPDDQNLRLVVLSPIHPHRSKNKESMAIRTATEINAKRGNQPRLNQNRLVYLAADEDAMAHVWNHTKRFLSWQSIVADKLMLNLDQHQVGEAEQSVKDAEGRLNGSLKEAFKWVLAPAQDANPRGGLTDVFWEESAIQTMASDMTDAIRKSLEDQERLIPRWSPIHLRNTLQMWFWRDEQPDVSTYEVWKAFCSYPYLPRLLDKKVLEEAIAAGVTSRDFFGYAISKNENDYEGLVFGESRSVFIDQQSLLIKPETALAQQERQKLPIIETGTSGGGDGGFTTGGTSSGGSTGTSTTGGTGTAVTPPITPPVQQGYKRYHGSVNLDPITMGLDAAKIAEEIIQHFTLQAGTQVNIRLEIDAFSPNGIPERSVRIIRENSRSLNFQLSEFEKE